MFEMFENDNLFEHRYYMNDNPRQQEILDLLYKKGRVSVSEFSKTLYVSEMTIRRDLAEMEKGGYLKRYRGGAVIKVDFREMPITERFLVDANEKKRLSELCKPFLRDNMTIYLDSSSTCLYVIPHLVKYKNVTLITNSVKAILNASALHIPCILIGGDYYEQDMCLVGSLAEDFAKDLNIDVSFMTTAAYSHDGVISDFDVRQTAMRKIILNNSKHTVFMFEKNKLGKKLTYTLCRSSDENITVLME